MRGDPVIPEFKRRPVLDIRLSQLQLLRLRPDTTPVGQPITEFSQHLLPLRLIRKEACIVMRPLSPITCLTCQYPKSPNLYPLTTRYRVTKDSPGCDSTRSCEDLPRLVASSLEDNTRPIRISDMKTQRTASSLL